MNMLKSRLSWIKPLFSAGGGKFPRMQSFFACKNTTFYLKYTNFIILNKILSTDAEALFLPNVKIILIFLTILCILH